MEVPGGRRLAPTKPELAVFVSGVASMGLEILAGRIVAPQFGSSIYTWGSIITIFLAALSLGYWRGGRRATTHASTDRLVWVLLFTAVYVAIVIAASDLLLSMTATIPLAPRYASIPAIVLLFGPPTYFLGFISPYAAELSQKDGVGAASGHVYALGTIGSILGAGGTTFVLVPTLAIDEIAFLFGVLLVVTAVGLAQPSFPRLPTAGIVVVALLLVGAFAAPTMGYSVQGEVVHEEETAYQQLQVIDRGDVRTMYLDGARHSALDTTDPDRHVYAYTRYFHLPYLYADDPDEIDRVLFVGGGGYTGPTSFLDRDPDVQVDVVEIDPAVTEAAERYFGLDEYAGDDRLSIHHQDGRTFLADTDAEYDAIVLDAYKQDQVPFELTTLEFFDLVEDRLSDDGVLVANVIAAPEGPASEFYRAEYHTIDQVLPQVDAYPTADSNAVQNIQLVATVDDRSLSDDDLRDRNADRDVGIDLEGEVETREPTVETDDVQVLRDDEAPVDSLLDPMVGQRYVIEETEDAGASGPGTIGPNTLPVSG